MTSSCFPSKLRLPLLAGPLFLTSLLVASPARADSAKDAAAETMFQEGRARFEEGRIAEACQRYEVSLELETAVGTLLHLADCYERLGRTASAWATFEKARSMAQSLGQESRAEMAAARVKELEPKLARLEIRIPPEARVPEMTAHVGDGAVPLASLGVPLPFDPGAQNLRISAPGHQTWATTVMLSAGKVEVVNVPGLTPTTRPARPVVPVASAGTLALGPDGSANGASGANDRTAPAKDTGTRGGTQRTIGLVGIGIGVAGLATGTVLGVLAHSKNEESLDACRPEDETLCTRRGVSLREEAEDFALASSIALGAGGGLVLTGLVVFLAAPSGDPQRDSAGGLAVIPIVGPDTLALRLRGSL